MPEHEERWFTIMRRFHQLNMTEELGVLPRGEMMVLMTVCRIRAEQGQRACSVSEIAKRQEISPPAISRSVRRLREKGLVEQVMDESDRRGAYLVITPLGLRTMEEDQARMRDFTRRAVSHLKPGELDEFYRIFDQIYRGAEAELARLHREKDKH